MLSILYYSLSKLLPFDDPTVVAFHSVNGYTWFTGVWEAIPDYRFLDAVLAIWTLFHLFVAVSFLAVPDAFYKRTLLQWHHDVAQTFYRIPFLVSTMTLALTIVTVRLCHQAFWTNGEDARMTLRAVVAAYTWIMALALQKLIISMIKLEGGVDRIMELEQEIERHDIQQWTPPPLWTRHLLAPINWILRPVMVGTHHLHGTHNKNNNDNNMQPSLFVSNHSLFGVEMGPFVAETYQATGVYMRGLADHFHFGQVHGELIRYFGGVDGTRANVDCLMSNQDNVLVYPGGGHEIMKPTQIPNYTLMWKERLGFVRMAIKHGYPIVPCCGVGTEDMMDRVFDIDLGFIRKDFKVPVILPVMPWRLQREYFWFGKPISTAEYHGDYHNDEIVRKVRDQVKAAVEAGIQEMQELQANDPNRFLYRHMMNATFDAVRRVMPSFRKDDTTNANNTSNHRTVQTSKKATDDNNHADTRQPPKLQSATSEGSQEDDNLCHPGKGNHNIPKSVGGTPWNDGPNENWIPLINSSGNKTAINKKNI